MGAKYTTLATSGYNGSPPSDAGAQAAENLISWSGIKTKLGDPVKTLADAINTALVSAFDYSVRQITTNDTTVAGDHMRCVEIRNDVSTAVIISLGDATTMTNLYRVFIKNSSAIPQTLTRITGGDTLDGVAASVVLAPGEGRIVQTNSGANGYVTNSRTTPFAHGADIASATTTVLDTATGDLVDVTGTTTITAITLAEGRCATVRFTGALTLTHGASLVLPGAANITTAAGDYAIFRGYASGVVRCVIYIPAAMPPTRPILSTEQASTSGTAINFTSIPSWVKKIVIQFFGVSTNGTSNLLIQLGASGGVEASGYLGASSSLAAGVSTANFTTGFGINLSSAAGVLHGTMTLTLEDASQFTWIATGAMAQSDSAGMYMTAGSKSTATALDRVRITTVNGTDAFDAGAINILYE